MSFQIIFSFTDISHQLKCASTTLNFSRGKIKQLHRICLNPSILHFNHLTLCVFFYSDGVFRTSLTDGTCHTNYFTFGGGIILLYNMYTDSFGVYFRHINV